MAGKTDDAAALVDVVVVGALRHAVAALLEVPARWVFETARG